MSNFVTYRLVLWSSLNGDIVGTNQWGWYQSSPLVHPHYITMKKTYWIPIESSKHHISRLRASPRRQVASSDFEMSPDGSLIIRGAGNVPWPWGGLGGLGGHQGWRALENGHHLRLKWKLTKHDFMGVFPWRFSMVMIFVRGHMIGWCQVAVVDNSWQIFRTWNHSSNTEIIPLISGISSHVCGIYIYIYCLYAALAKRDDMFWAIALYMDYEVHYSRL